MRLLLIGDERKNRRMLAWGFADESYSVKLASSRESTEAAIEDDAFQAACIDWKMQSGDAASIVEMLHRRVPELPIVALIGEKDRALGPTLRSQGVADSLVTPFPIENLHT